MLRFIPWHDHDRKRTARARIRHRPLPHSRRPCRPRTPWPRWPRRPRRSSCPVCGVRLRDAGVADQHVSQAVVCDTRARAPSGARHRVSGAVKLTKSSSIDPQDTGLRASREPAMLGIRNDRQPHLDNTFVALPGSHLITAHKHQNQAAARARYPALTRAQRRPGPAVRRECPGQVARHRARR